jgi:hypothetical protein
VNEQSPSPPPRPASEPEYRPPDEQDVHAADDAPSASDDTVPHRENEDAQPQSQREPAVIHRPAPIPPPLPSFGAPPAAPRIAESPQRQPEQSQRAPESAQRVQDPPAYPPRVPAPQPAPTGSVSEPPRPYEGGRYVPPPPAASATPSGQPREWPGMTYTTIPPANAASAAAKPAPAVRGNGMQTALLGLIAALLLALAILVGINTFAPRSPKPSGVQQVQVQRQAIKQQTANEVKDTIAQAQQALDQFTQQAQQAYQNAQSDAERQDILLQLSINLQRITAQQNNDLLLIYQDLYTQP